MSNICGQVSTPSVDNTNAACDTIVSDTCVVVETICKKVKNEKGGTLKDFIEKLCSKISQMDTKIYELSMEVKVLKEKLEN